MQTAGHAISQQCARRCTSSTAPVQVPRSCTDSIIKNLLLVPHIRAPCRRARTPPPAWHARSAPRAGRAAPRSRCRGHCHAPCLTRRADRPPCRCLPPLPAPARATPISYPACGALLLRCARKTAGAGHAAQWRLLPLSKLHIAQSDNWTSLSSYPQLPLGSKTDPLKCVT
eukprot:6188299-Pleurochrysis_carterae.AAC.7